MAEDIVIVDYGMGNLRSVQKALESVGADARISSSPGDMDAAGMVLPGVGAFRDAMDRLGGMGLVRPITDHIEADKPFLGICLGLHLLFAEGEEFGVHSGLGVLPGRVVRFDGGKKIPHMGWNTIDIVRSDSILKGIRDKSYFYFVHSYYGELSDNRWIGATTDYGEIFPSVIIRDNLFATQFHPEKSQKIGKQLLGNFLSIVRGAHK